MASWWSVNILQECVLYSIKLNQNGLCIRNRNAAMCLVDQTPPDQTSTHPLTPDTPQTRHSPPDQTAPPCEQTDACENITFHASLRYAVGKNSTNLKCVMSGKSSPIKCMISTKFREFCWGKVCCAQNQGR